MANGSFWNPKTKMYEAIEYEVDLRKIKLPDVKIFRQRISEFKYDIPPAWHRSPLPSHVISIRAIVDGDIFGSRIYAIDPSDLHRVYHEFLFEINNRL